MRFFHNSKADHVPHKKKSTNREQDQSEWLCHVKNGHYENSERAVVG